MSLTLHTNYGDYQGGAELRGHPPNLSVPNPLSVGHDSARSDPNPSLSLVPGPTSLAH